MVYKSVFKKNRETAFARMLMTISQQCNRLALGSWYAERKRRCRNEAY